MDTENHKSCSFAANPPTLQPKLDPVRAAAEAFAREVEAAEAFAREAEAAEAAEAPTNPPLPAEPETDPSVS